MRFLLFVVLTSLVVVAHAAKGESLRREIEWTLSLDADGKIESLEPIDRDYLPEVRQQIEPIVRTWHFTPGKINGRPASTETTLWVTVSFEAESTNSTKYQARIASASTGPRYQHVVSPHYPEAAQHAHSEGEVMLWITFDAEGRVTSAKSYPQMSADHVAPMLVEAALDAVKHWTFRPETVAGHGVASEALVPFCFKMANGECHWKPSPGKSAVRSGQAIALSSVVGIETGDARHLP
ncbi:MAG TPA: energy transducer TonB [Rhodanobacteraceae bacterium]|nr:energy transducer TonB [Rhodanobacteraceae bacterium]